VGDDWEADDGCGADDGRSGVSGPVAGIAAGAGVCIPGVAAGGTSEGRATASPSEDAESDSGVCSTAGSSAVVCDADGGEFSRWVRRVKLFRIVSLFIRKTPVTVMKKTSQKMTAIGRAWEFFDLPDLRPLFLCCATRP
jgi:hypothetical protein